jgi:tetraacyldisaccharide 4'-kinase
MIFKKPLFWDSKKQGIFSIILFPFTILTNINNFLLSISNKKINNKIFSICVGNIYVGGTGKTPLAIKLYQILNKNHKGVVVGKKFYSSHTDEINLLKKKVNTLIKNKRSLIIQEAIKKNKKIIIFDDGLQDKALKYDLNFVCFDTLNWIGNGNLIPAGPLREKINSLKKFDAVFLKNISKPNNKIIRIIKKINPKIKIFNTRYKILNFNNFSLKDKYLIFSGIGNPDSFFEILKINKFLIKDQFIFPDHYSYTEKDFLNIIETSKKLNTKIITTEKDFIKIPKRYQKKIKCLKVDLEIDNKKKLINFINEKI